MVISNVMICRWGLFDSIVVGKLCGSASSPSSTSNSSADTSALRRSVRSDSGSRLCAGRSVTIESYFDYRHGGCEPVKRRKMRREEGLQPLQGRVKRTMMPKREEHCPHYHHHPPLLLLASWLSVWRV